MIGVTDWPPGRLSAFWALQTRARKVNLHLTATADGRFRLRTRLDDVGASLTTLAEVEAVIVAKDANLHVSPPANLQALNTEVVAHE
jgi:hypothetical protein